MALSRRTGRSLSRSALRLADAVRRLADADAGASPAQHALAMCAAGLATLLVLRGLTHLGQQIGHALRAAADSLATR